MRLLPVAISCVLLLVGCSSEAIQKSNTNAVPITLPPPPPWLTSLPRTTGTVVPVYPGFEAVYGMEGRVVLLVLISKDGNPLDVKVDHSAGSRELDRAALVAIAQWQFSPGKKSGAAVESYVRIPVIFNEPNKGDLEWPTAYRHVPIKLDDAPIPYATVAQAVVGVATRAHEMVYDGTHDQYHKYVIRDDKKAVREIWYFTDILTDRAMAIRYTFTGASSDPKTLVATLCNKASLCGQRRWAVEAGPYSKRVFTE